MSYCTICIRPGHTASSCKHRPQSTPYRQTIAAQRPVILTEVSPPPDDWNQAWERLKREMKGRQP